MPFFGGSKAASAVHDKIVERLQSEFGYDQEDAKAVKSLMYDWAKENASENMTGLEKAKMMEEKLTKKFLKGFTSDMIEERKEKIRAIREAKKQKGGRRKKTSKKASRKASKKTSKRKTSKKASKKTSKRKTSKKASKRKASSKRA